MKTKPVHTYSDFVVTVYRRVKKDYIVLETIEAGLVLVGSEVKSLRQGQCQLKDSYVVFQKGEAYLQNMHISTYKPATDRNHHPERKRKLLLHDYELKKLLGHIQQKGWSCVPLKVYFKKGRAKVQLALAKGRKKGDKREYLKTKEMDKLIRRRMQKNHYRSHT